MKKTGLVVIQNDPEVPIGSYGTCLEEWAIPFTVVALYERAVLPPADNFGAVIVLGGSMGVHDTDRHPFLDSLKTWIVRTVASKVPYLGICLGGQLLADVFGAHVHSPSPFGEKGMHPVTLTSEGSADILFSGINSTFNTFQWHQDAFDLPEKAIRLALSPRCPNQAFRFGPKAWGLQFHPEMTEELVRLWSGWNDSTRANTPFLVNAFKQLEQEYHPVSRQLLKNFLKAGGFF